MKGIYIIKNIQNKKYYIGSSKDIKIRIRTHKSKLRRGIHANIKLQNSWDKYGEESFEFKLIYEMDKKCTKEDLLDVEQKFLDYSCRKMSLNLSFVAHGGGSDLLKKKVLLVDLFGNIVIHFESLSSASKFCRKYQQKANTFKIINKFYRLFTPDFYKENKDLILSKSPVKSVVKKRVFKAKKEKINFLILIDICEVSYEFFNFESIFEQLGLSRAYVSRMIKGSVDNIYNIRRVI